MLDPAFLSLLLKSITRVFLICFFVLALVTVVRSNLQSNTLNIQTDKTESLSLLFEGQSLKGATRIYKFYDDNEYFLGQTYFDMLLLPIPRSIYKNKPEWYGIDDISHGMNLPSTSQSSVSLFGEAYANFGFFGIFTIPIWVL